jgi:hypothetical protein
MDNHGKFQGIAAIFPGSSKEIRILQKFQNLIIPPPSRERAVDRSRRDHVLF